MTLKQPFWFQTMGDQSYKPWIGKNGAAIIFSKLRSLKIYKENLQKKRMAPTLFYSSIVQALNFNLKSIGYRSISRVSG